MIFQPVFYLNSVMKMDIWIIQGIDQSRQDSQLYITLKMM